MHKFSCNDPLLREARLKIDLNYTPLFTFPWKVRISLLHFHCPNGITFHINLLMIQYTYVKKDRHYFFNKTTFICMCVSDYRVKLYLVQFANILSQILTLLTNATEVMAVNVSACGLFQYITFIALPTV